MNDEFNTLFHVQLAVHEVYKLCRPTVFQNEAIALLIAPKTSTCGLLIALVSTTFYQIEPTCLTAVLMFYLYMQVACLH